MDIKPIKTDEDYQAALAEIDRLFDAIPNTPEGDRLEIFVALVEAYERQHFPKSLPDPIEAIEHYMESRSLTRRDLEPFIGNRARVSEILNRKRALTLRMIRNLEEGLGIPAEILVQKYDLTPASQEVESRPPLEAQEPAHFSEPFAQSSHFKSFLEHLETSTCGGSQGLDEILETISHIDKETISNFVSDWEWSGTPVSHKFRVDSEGIPCVA